MNFDAYTIRKMAPRLLVAVVAVNVSIYLCLAAVDLTAVLGGGLHQMLLAPFDDTSIGSYKLGAGADSVSGGLLASGLIGVLVAGIFASGLAPAVAVGAIVLAVLLVLVIALFGLAVIFTLVVRQGLLMFLIITSPVAIALFVLPGTEKYFRQWLKLFTAMLMLYPIAAIIFAMTDIMVGLILQG